MKQYVHFIGIGGIGNSALAQIYNQKGFIVSGSDNVPSKLTESLKKQGIKVFYEHKAEHISKKHSLVVYSPAIMRSNPELKEAKRLKIKCLSYPQALGLLTKKHYTIAVAGSHGKSTTTAMIALLLNRAGLDPTVVVGTKIREFGNKNYRIGKSKYLVIEACEYKDSFLNFSPKILVITNIEADHLDYFKNFKRYQSSFAKLTNKVPRNGAIVISKEINSVVLKKAKAKLYTVSSSNKKADFLLSGHKLSMNNKVEQSLSLKPAVIGDFNIYNSALAAIVGKILHITNNKIEQSISAFKGTWRRLENRGFIYGKTLFIDDYGHHPTEIKKTLHAIREKHPGKKVLCIFQPHQYNRTKALLRDFGKSFTEVDEVIIPDIYKVRDSEKDIKAVSAESLVKEIAKHHKKVSSGGGLKKTAEYVKKNYKKYHLVVTMGAGDIDGIYNYF